MGAATLCVVQSAVIPAMDIVLCGANYPGPVVVVAVVRVVDVEVVRYKWILL